MHQSCPAEFGSAHSYLRSLAAATDSELKGDCLKTSFLASSLSLLLFLQMLSLQQHLLSGLWWSKQMCHYLMWWARPWTRRLLCLGRWSRTLGSNPIVKIASVHLGMGTSERQLLWKHGEHRNRLWVPSLSSISTAAKCGFDTAFELSLNLSSPFYLMLMLLVKQVKRWLACF